MQRLLLLAVFVQLWSGRSFANCIGRTNLMFRVFNCVQITALLGAGPMILGWLHKATFAYHTGAFWLAMIVYAVLFIANVAVLCVGAEKWGD